MNGHIESSYTLATSQWSPPKFVTDPYLRIHGLSPALNYGLQAFEGIKAFRTPTNRIAIFRPQKNAARMQHSATFLSIPSIPEAHFLKCIHLAVGANAEFVPPHNTDAAMYIRPIVFGSGAQLSLSPPDEYIFSVYVAPTGTYHGAHAIEAVILEDFDRAAPQGTGSVKIGGNYAPVFRFSEKARAEGFGITLHLDSKTRSEIDEFTTSGFIGVRIDGAKITLVVPDSENVLKSVTSDSACAIATSLGWTVERRRVPYEELSSFTEVIAAGTAAALVPIKSITMRSTADKFLYRDGSERPEWVISTLLRTLRGIQMGKIEDTFGWLDYVEDPRKLLPQAQGMVSSGELADIDGVKTSVDLLA